MLDTMQIMLWALILMRMSGFILINPILGRRNIPMMMKTGFIMVLSFTIYSMSAGMVVPDPTTSIEYGILLLKEFAVGVIIAFVMDVFFYIVTYAGGIIDFQMGMSMATIYDPQTNAQSALTGTVFNGFLYLLFFAVDGHLALIKIFMTSGELVPYGQVVIGSDAAWAVLNVFCQCTVLAVKLSLPIIAIEFLTEMAVGILMKAIPQINVFMVNIQIKVAVGVLMLLVLCMPIGEYLDSIISMMLRTVQEILYII